METLTPVISGVWVSTTALGNLRAFLPQPPSRNTPCGRTTHFCTHVQQSSAASLPYVDSCDVKQHGRAHGGGSSTPITRTGFFSRMISRGGQQRCALGRRAAPLRPAQGSPPGARARAPRGGPRLRACGRRRPRPRAALGCA